MLSKETRELMRENAYTLLEMLIMEKSPFRIVIWNADNWNRPLPHSIMDDFPTQLVLDIKEEALDDSFVDEFTGEVIISTMFEGIEHYKTVLYDEIIAILDLDGQPYLLNNFYPETDTDTMQFTAVSPTVTKDAIVDMVTSEGVPNEAASKSMETFIKNNPFLKHRLKLKDNSEN
jgi:hypothetical protein